MPPDGGWPPVVGVQQTFLADSVILSAAKNLAVVRKNRRFFAALRMT
jgi:hypothetical protein